MLGELSCHETPEQAFLDRFVSGNLSVALGMYDPLKLQHSGHPFTEYFPFELANDNHNCLRLAAILTQKT